MCNGGLFNKYMSMYIAKRSRKYKTKQTKENIINIYITIKYMHGTACITFMVIEIIFINICMQSRYLYCSITLWDGRRSLYEYGRVKCDAKIRKEILADFLVARSFNIIPLLDVNNIVDIYRSFFYMIWVYYAVFGLNFSSHSLIVWVVELKKKQNSHIM